MENLSNQLIFNNQQIEKILFRLAAQIFELANFNPNLKILAIQPRGLLIAGAILEILKTKFNLDLPLGTIDPSFHRDDLNKANRLIIPSESSVPFEVENQPILLIDDVIYTGRTTRAAMEALLEIGRPKWIKLLVLINRYLEREIPISVDFEGFRLDSGPGEVVRVRSSNEQKIEVRISHG
jgi:pyrimidine operon attenuation protein/uracil phosphoribosyltransferase